MNDSAYSLRRADAVLEATLDVLAEVGFARMTVDMIAARAHASKATIYRRWATKGELVCAAASQVEVEHIPVVPGDPARALRAILTTLRAMTVGRLGRLVTALHSAASDDVGIRRSVDDALVRPLHERTAAAVAQLREAGLVRADADVELAAIALIALTVDRALATGIPISEQDVELMLQQWVLPALSPQWANRTTKGPTAGPG